MYTLVEKVLEKIPQDIFSDQTLFPIMGGTPNSRYSRVRLALARNNLIHVRRGLYTLPKKFQRRGVNLFTLAQYIYGPSYISFESALSHHGWIPEAVYAATSASAKRSRDFQTPYGLFSYTHIPQENFYLGVERVEAENGIYLMANPWKALTDYIYANKKDWKGLHPIVESLRVEPEMLEKPDIQFLYQLKGVYHQKRVSQFIDSIIEESAP